MAIIGLILGLIIFLPDHFVHNKAASTMGKGDKLFTAFTVLVTVLVSTLPMTLAPSWNGTVKGHRDQYERIAESFLEGKLYIDYQDIDPRLLEMENPYDRDARNEAGVKYHWDHAFYKGRYYVYFGVVPVLLLFLPFRAITGHALNTLYATQIFTGFAIVGIFALFRLLARRFFREMTLGTYLILSMAVSVLSFWFASDYAALYCTATSSAVCMQVWSFYFFFKAVYWEKKENRQILLAALGALFGALAFGCRPSAALANILVIPLLVNYLRSKKITAKLVGKLFLAALPYLIVAVGLMAYNYARFDNPFEFGQSYQLTSADQSAYGSFSRIKDLVVILNGFITNFVSSAKLSATFPWFNYGGVFWNFPLLLLSLTLFLPFSLRAARRRRLSGVLMTLMGSAALITVIDVLWSPYLLERYRMDIYYLMGIATFFAVGLLDEKIGQTKDAVILRSAVVLLSLNAMFNAMMFWLIPYGTNYTQMVKGGLQEAAYFLFFINIPS